MDSRESYGSCLDVNQAEEILSVQLNLFLPPIDARFYLKAILEVVKQARFSWFPSLNYSPAYAVNRKEDNGRNRAPSRRAIPNSTSFAKTDFVRERTIDRSIDSQDATESDDTARACFQVDR